QLLEDLHRVGYRGALTVEYMTTVGWHGMQAVSISQETVRTRDAQGVYAPLGFRTIVNPEQWMVIQTNRPARDPFPGL
ncbi:MAG: hypothetical protein HGA76_12110, partial [Candidatus Firestonebacteria bacterium]|nr:hypothetical protein [Candidatus Firestonebacteria bacterium]